MTEKTTDSSLVWCKHNYVAEKVKHPVRKSNYLYSGSYDTCTLDIEKIVIFCKKCWDAKYVLPPDKKQDD